MAQAGCITFNDTILGNIEVATFDWKVGNALSKGGVLSGTGTAQLYYQASLLGFLDANGDEITGTGLNTDYELTVVASFEQDIMTMGNISTFSLGSNGGFFEVWRDSLTDMANLKADDLAGTGFRDGMKILEGDIIVADGVFFFTGGTAQYDQFNNDDYAGKQTLTGTGGTSFTGQRTASDDSFIDGCDQFFIDLLVGNASQITPFNQADPSMLFLDGAVTPDLGTINGQSGPDFQFQADGNNSFTTAIPVPGAVWMLGSGILGLVALRRKFAV
jgi:hypothetical protein